MDLEGKWKAIMIGGMITGLAPFVPVLNIACCIIPMLGAVIAIVVYRSSDPSKALNYNDGIVIGAVSGAAGAILYAVILIPLVLLVGEAVSGVAGRAFGIAGALPYQVRRILEGIFSNMGNFLGVLLLFKIVSHLALSLVFGTLGGLLGIALFRKSASA
jgi:hypothetical protein